ncbi:major coat protein [Aeromonas rivipollensis]|uniref:major coat protein n=1 Tax=Aeromonas rivipollensis TaxID=948519 RepID=UPI000FA1D738|nr:major coat protein [Aeromonas rivipollensis]MDM5057793.1 Flexible pilin [Aeromonas rivipollensis]
MKNYLRNGCIAVVASLSAAGAAQAAGEGTAAAAGAALDSTLSDVTATSPKVMMVVATVVGVGILIGLMRKA